MNIAGVSLLLPQEVVDPSLDVGSESGDLELLRSELFVLFSRCSRCFVATVTFEPDNINVNPNFKIFHWDLLSGNFVKVKNTNLMESSSAILAIDEWFRLKSIILTRLKLIFWNMPAIWIYEYESISLSHYVNSRLRLAWVITKTNSVTRNVLKTLLTKCVLVREEAGRWISGKKV